MAEQKPKQATKERRPDSKPVLQRQGLWLLVAVLVLVVIGVVSAYALYYGTRFLPRSFVGDVEVSGLTQDEASAVVREAQNRFTAQQVTFVSESTESVVQLAGVTVASDQALQDLWISQKNVSWWQYGLGLLRAVALDSRKTPVVTLEESLVRPLLSVFETNHQEADIRITGQVVAVVPGSAGIKVNLQKLADSLAQSFPESGKITVYPEAFEPEIAAASLEPLRQQVETILAKNWEVTLSNTKTATITPEQMARVLDTEVVSSADGSLQRVVSVDDGELVSLVTSWASVANTKPVNARLSVQNGTVVVAVEGTSGVALDEEETKKRVISALTKKTPQYSIEAKVVEALPEVRTDTLAALGLTERIATASTDFSGSPQNRAYNIKLGQRNLDRTLIKSGEEYSTIANLGPIDEAAGFLAELVIKNNRTIPEAGGGLCQVSTTLFRAVLNAGLPITERQNHSYRVSYYERGVGPGLDATIYSPKPDFRWKNDLGSAIYVQSAVQGEVISFELYGTNDGRKSTISAPQILEETPAPEPIYSQTEELFVGEERQLERARSGMKTVVRYTVERSGAVIATQEFRSTYKPWAAQYLVGTKQRPGSTPAPEPTPTPTVIPAP
jgi:vancomycin resistance protein YoaR